jgi:hypothetical protein
MADPAWSDIIALRQVDLGLHACSRGKEYPMDERRRETRRKFMAFTPVYDLHPRTLLGYLGDLSLRGALVIGEKLVTIIKQTELESDFPSVLPDINVVPVIIPGRFAWCRQEDSPPYFNIGVEFTGVTPEQAELFQQILERYHFRHVLSDTDFDRE